MRGRDPYGLLGLESREKIDTGKMLVRIHNYPEDLREAVSRYIENCACSLFEPLVREYNGVVVVGMGGSAIGGLFLRDVLSNSLDVPIFVERGMGLPGFVDSRYLVIVVSYSGNTEETLRSLADAVGRGITPICISSDGMVEEIAAKKNFPLLKLPGGLQPRESFPYMAVALLATLRHVGLDSIDVKAEIEEASSLLERNRDSIMEAFSRGGTAVRLPSGEGGMADAVSSIVCGATPVVYSYAPYLSPGYRAKTQFNENAKIHAFCSELPEANHNEIMGWGCSAALDFKPVIIRGKVESEPMKHRMDFLEGLFEEKGARPAVIRSSIGKLVPELITLFYTVDVLSVAVALRRGVDPTPVGTISELKKYLGARINLRDELHSLFT